LLAGKNFFVSTSSSSLSPTSCSSHALQPSSVQLENAARSALLVFGLLLVKKSI
jgi:hypothetical protein